MTTLSQALKHRFAPTRHWIERAMRLSALAVFFLTSWWFRPGPNRDGDPYFFGFVVTIPWGLTLILWVLTGLGGQKAWKRAAYWIVPFGILTFWIFLSQSWAPFPEPAWNGAMEALGVCAFAIAMATAGPAPGKVAAVLTGSLVFQGMVAIAQALRQRSAGLQAVGEILMPTSDASLSYLRADGLQYLRPYGLTAHPNLLGGFLAVALVACFALLMSRGVTGWRLLAAALAAPIGWWALLLSFSRSAWIATVITFVFLLILWRLKHAPIRWSRLPIVASIALGILCLFIASFSSFFLARTGLGDSSNELRSVTDRALFIKYAYQMINIEPITGVGIANNSWVAAQFIQDDPLHPDLVALPVHNVPLLVWSELGIVGLVLWLATILGGVFVFIHNLRDGILDPAVSGLLAGFVILLIIGLFDFYTWGLFPYLLLWWSLLAAALHREPPDRKPVT